MVSLALVISVVVGLNRKPGGAGSFCLGGLGGPLEGLLC